MEHKKRYTLAQYNKAHKAEVYDLTKPETLKRLVAEYRAALDEVEAINEKVLVTVLAGRWDGLNGLRKKAIKARRHYLEAALRLVFCIEAQTDDEAWRSEVVEDVETVIGGYFEGDEFVEVLLRITHGETP